MKLTAKCVANVWCLFEGEALIAIVRGDDQDVDYEQKAKRITACVNACAGIPTETLEAGGVVVPANVAKRLWLYALNAAADYFAVASDNKRYDGYRDDKLCEHQQALDDARFLLNVIERFQQNGGENE